ncbi:ABC-type transport system periplasmic substrate-binding protein (probable substrate phosphate) [Natrialba magadii ATCC 43099]|uniref:ABC-type transport system periplasmic substrate-binding protein (Probable substrate phosphate) n=1 Tax=Natrialba magadii (strain ATCC 43099 / DSM 3394 / CCM 3739 / CIP 104546 / IAM 13178 / JCM 8861 / NBRC 102185 / NCIMB 2190 / MS3) TaxID=547559 RepID=D3SY41_NATMM|nr:PstS family phosphate ABC transporter substrate-binding protein [Natrialba magadii]ADD04081.1 ABC-type transport system periplasmic substrate-binding protein (probable substrate phosphate) [Natrialba magadii ATCC 43099]ELY33238.1 phosphate ABC transporter substrate-binding protein [Natrialba magadii ATCC 43099]
MGNEPITGRSDGGSRSGSGSLSTTRRRVLLGVSGSTLAGLAGCLTRGEDSGLEGEIRIDGSNTLRPNSALVAEQFMWENNRVQASVSASGTGAGFQQFARREISLQNASRPITDEEAEHCRENGVEWLELEVVLDGIALLKHPDNDWCECLTVDELGDLWERGSDIETWADLEPEQSDEEWPDEEISFYGRDAASGTFDYFTEHITGSVGNIRNDYSGTPDTNNIIRGVRGNEYTIGFGGAGYYYENEADAELIAVNYEDGEDPGDEWDDCIVPTRESIEAEAYQPLSRPMYIYVRRDELARPEYREFVRFYLENTQETAREVQFYAVPDETIADQRETLEAAIEDYT